jgi:hypothetical protein
VISRLTEAFVCRIFCDAPLRERGRWSADEQGFSSLWLGVQEWGGGAMLRPTILPRKQNQPSFFSASSILLPFSLFYNLFNPYCLGVNWSQTSLSKHISAAACLATIAALDILITTIPQSLQPWSTTGIQPTWLEHRLPMTRSLMLWIFMNGNSSQLLLTPSTRPSTHLSTHPRTLISACKQPGELFFFVS